MWKHAFDALSLHLHLQLRGGRVVAVELDFSRKVGKVEVVLDFWLSQDCSEQLRDHHDAVVGGNFQDVLLDGLE